MELEKGEIIEIPVENPTKFTNAKQPEIGIIFFKFLLCFISIGYLY